MTPLSLALTVVFGGVIGVFSGLLGLGGGVLLVPVLYWALSAHGIFGAVIPPEIQPVVAHATSLFVIIPIALAGVWEFHKKKRVVWTLAIPMGLGAVVGATLGAHVAQVLPGAVLKAGFGVVLAAAGAKLLWGGPTSPEGAGGEVGAVGARAAIGGVLIGFLAALLGVGGGIVAVPFLIYVLHLDVRSVAGTSLGMIVFAATAATVTYGFSGWEQAGLPAGSVGFIYLPMGVALIPGAVLAVRLGARMNQRMTAAGLRRLFGFVFVVLGCRLLILNLLAL